MTEEEKKTEEKTEEEKVENGVSEVEANLPENTLENPQPTLFKVDKNDLYEHTQYIRTFPKNLDVKAPSPGEFVDTKSLNEAEDEYKVIKRDPKGEAKITENGYLLGGRKFIISTFTLPGRGKKLFVLGTEAAKFLNSRDAFVLFNRYKQLYKSKTNDEERQFLDECNFSISKIKSRSVAVTTAKNLFMVFGARVVKGGKRVEDDYWEETAIEQGFKPTDQVFPIDRTYAPKAEPVRPKVAPKPVAPKIPPKFSYVAPQPSFEDRKEYLHTFAQGNPSQVYPGQGISGGFELATVATIPKYKQDGSTGTKHRSLLSSLSTNNSSTSLVSQSTSIPINDSLVGEKSPGGLPYYHSSVVNRINREDAEKIKEVEYLHGTVETNNYIALARKPRNKQWSYYWQVKAGAPLGLVEKNKEKFVKDQEEELQKVQEETIYNEFLYCDQIIKKRKVPNPNYLNHGNISGLKPPYAENPVQSQPIGQVPQIPGQIPQGPAPMSQPYQAHPSQVHPFPQQHIPQAYNPNIPQQGVIPQHNMYNQHA